MRKYPDTKNITILKTTIIPTVIAMDLIFS